MTSEEIMRRLKVLVDMPAEKRPFSVYRLEKVAKVTQKYVYRIVRDGHTRITEPLRKRLGNALELLENGQVVADPQPRVDGKRKNQFAEQPLRIVDKKNPPQCIVRRVHFGDDGKPKVVNVVYNPAALQKS